ncbi:Unknown protein sequence [Pseudomonas syringae pv. maculicola]|nr:Unknown protein sequence [Pseudomonas syringae pv. maculicola]
MTTLLSFCAALVAVTARLISLEVLAFISDENTCEGKKAQQGKH